MNCEYIPSAVSIQKAEKAPLARVITDFVSVICEQAKQSGDSILHLLLWENNIRWQDTGLKHISYVISNFRSTSAVFDDYPENLTTTDNTHK